MCEGRGCIGVGREGGWYLGNQEQDPVLRRGYGVSHVVSHVVGHMLKSNFMEASVFRFVVGLVSVI